MAKKSNSAPQRATAARIARTEAYAEKVRTLFAATVNRIIELNKRLPNIDEGEMFSFDAQTEKLRAEVERALRQLHSVATTAIQQGIEVEWNTANDECDRIVQSVFGKKALNNPEFGAWLKRNNSAMRAFIARSDAGMNLSDRVWQSTRQLRDEMEIAITCAIGDGTSAATMSRHIRQYLNDPDLMFRRFRYKDPETGEWRRKWKKRIIDPETGKVTWIDYDKGKYEDQWTGRGYYKSAAQNAMRVARTETNIAYRRADNARWQQMDFVLGQRVQMSKNHPRPDICDKLAGDYPKDFVFDGWHPQCFCFVTPILIDDDVYDQLMDKDDWRGELQRYADAHRIKGYPDNFQSWVNDNADKIADARRRGTEPYFIRNNAAAIADILNPQKQPSPLEIAEQRHASRTPEDVERVQKAWAQRQSSNALIEHLQKYGDFEYHYGGKLDEASAYKHWERLTTEQRLNVLAKGKFTGMLPTEDDLDFCNIYCITDKRRMTDTLQEVLMNVKEGYNMEDENHYVFHFKNGKQILFSEDLGKPLSKRDLERLDWLCANGGLSNYRYWFADEKAKAQMMQYMGFVEYVNGKVTPESLLELQISELMQKAQRAGQTIQSTAEEIAHRHSAVVTPINFKSRDSIRRKVLSERKNPETPDFAPSELKDAVRNTIVAPRHSLDAIIKELQSCGIFMRYKPQHTELGYVGNIINVRTQQGIIGEIQVNTPAMIYAKEPPEIAKAIIGDDVWERIHKQTNVAGGLGHKYYEEWRVMSIEEQQSERGQNLLRESLEYYAIFAKL